MKCVDCGGTMSTRRGNYKYTASGLPYVTLRNVEIRRCKACGEEEVVIPRIENLHRALALAVITKPSRLTPEEIRFLRKYLGWSGTDFAKYMGVKPESVSKWENDKAAMGAVADRLLRLMVATGSPVKEYPLDPLETFSKLTQKRTAARINVGIKKDQWLTAVA